MLLQELKTTCLQQMDHGTTNVPQVEKITPYGLCANTNNMVLKIYYLVGNVRNH